MNDNFERLGFRDGALLSSTIDAPLAAAHLALERLLTAETLEPISTNSSGRYLRGVQAAIEYRDALAAHDHLTDEIPPIDIENQDNAVTPGQMPNIGIGGHLIF
jgi:hypothetical protein